MKAMRISAWLSVFLGAVFACFALADNGAQPLKLNIHRTSGTGIIEIVGGSGLVEIEYASRLDNGVAWSLLDTVNASTGPYYYADSTATNDAMRFYRAAIKKADNTNAVNTAPILAAIENCTVVTSTTLTFAVSASDADLPAQNLTFNLEPGAPAGADIAPNGVFHWTPTPSQSPSTNAVTVTVTDDGTPPLSAAQSFYIVVREVSTPLVQTLVWISPGTFTMGSPSTEPGRESIEGPLTVVTLSRGFWMSQYETTQADYLAVMDTNPSHFTGDLKRPVEAVSWAEATNYCAKMTERERAAGRLPSGYIYRLPTEAEWEYACRAGTTTATGFGNSLSSAQANFDGNYPYGGAARGAYLGTTAPVGSYSPNAWGLYDMHGNVCEWCLDKYAASLPGGSVTNPGGAKTGLDRVLRGGVLGGERKEL